MAAVARSTNLFITLLVKGDIDPMDTSTCIEAIDKIVLPYCTLPERD